MSKFSFFKTRMALFRKLLGLIIIMGVGYMSYGETATIALSETSSVSAGQLALKSGILNPYPAPDIIGIDAWINSSPLTLNNLKGKVILIDFWTYSCINCIRTLPYIKDWYRKYHDKGLVIIGVHTPEFDFEKDLTNVRAAVTKDGILYPVALDNQFKTWQNYDNRYWPAHYLIDKNNQVVYTHFGEGDYDITENNIRYLLDIKEPVKPSNSVVYTSTDNESPETYLGYARLQNFASPQSIVKDLPGQYTFPDELPLNHWALQGSWDIAADRIISMQAGAELKYKFNAKKVFMVMGSKNNKPIQVKVMLNGEKLVSNKGKDVTNSIVTVDKHTLYDIVNLSEFGSGVLQITTFSPGLEVYTFTFGS